MVIEIADDPKSLGEAAGRRAAALIRKAIRENGTANIILATGTSQFNTLDRLIREEISWQNVVAFHLDEYIGISGEHPASFRRYLRERFLSRVPALRAVHLINGEADPEAECIWLGDLIARHPIDVALVGIGENGHLAFNDPPADFETDEPYLVVELDDACRRQQLGEGWFKDLASVPVKAISMSIRQIMRSAHIISSVPDARKAGAVKNCLEGRVSNLHPASILQKHASCEMYLDTASASLLQRTQSVNDPRSREA